MQTSEPEGDLIANFLSVAGNSDQIPDKLEKILRLRFDDFDEFSLIG